jgi:tetratricopeptide (TPR) repeat protein
LREAIRARVRLQEEKMITTAALERALAPVTRRIHRDSSKVRRPLVKVLTTLAKSIACRKFSLQKVWKEAEVACRYSKDLAADLDQTLQAYASDRRMEYTAAILLDADLTKTDSQPIMEALGFNYKSFCRTFSIWSGQSPKAFRDEPNPEIVERLRRLRVDDDGPGLDKPKSAIQQSLLDAIYEKAATESTRQKLHHGRTAAALGYYEEATDLLTRVLDIAVDDQFGEIAAAAHGYLGYVLHREATRLFEHEDLDTAYDQLVLAEAHYGEARPLPNKVKGYRAHIALPHDPHAALLNSLCPRCRTRLLGRDGAEVCFHLDHALGQVCRDLPWFRDACDDCYYVVWQAFVFARLAQLDDAWRAFWLAHAADPLAIDAPPSIGRFVAFLQMSEEVIYGDQADRAHLARQAVDVAVALDDPVREAFARLYLGNACRAMGEHQDAEAEFQQAAKAAEDVPWLKAFWCFAKGALEIQQGQEAEALKSLREAFGLYRDLDSHTAGLVRMQEGEVHRSNHRYDEALEIFLSCEPLLDGRRAPLMRHAVLFINLTATFIGLSRWDEAAATLARCDYDRNEHRGLLAPEHFALACIALGRGRPHDALPLFAKAITLCEELDRWLDVALAMLYTVEAYSAVNDRILAIESCTEALKNFRIAGCDHKTEESLARLGELLKPLAVDLTAVVGYVRRLALRHGGHLPVVVV